jgi:hypothetical protein
MLTAVLLSILSCVADGDAPRERLERLQFEGAGDIVAVTVLEAEDNRTLKVETTDVLQGYGVPRTLHLRDLGADAKAGSRWIVHLTTRWSNNQEVASKVPDNEEQRRRILGLVAAPWRRAAFVVLARIPEAPVAGRPREYQVDVVRVLYGSPDLRKVWFSVHGEDAIRPVVPGPGLLVLCVSSVYPGSSPYAVDVETWIPVDDSKVMAIEKDLETRNRASHLEEVRLNQDRIRGVETAWRFHEAKLVARVGISGIHEEPTNMGGMHFRYELQEWLRGKFEAGDGDRNGLFIGGGHAYHGPEKKGQGYVAAGPAVGEHPVATIPLTDPRSKQVSEWLTLPTPSFACRPVDPGVFDPAQTPVVPDRLPSAGSVVFNPPLSMDSTPPDESWDWLHFRVVRRRAVESKGRVWHWVHCKLAEEGPEWMFAGDELADLTEGSEWWGRCVLAGPRSKQDPKLWSQGRLFLGGLLLPAAGVTDRELAHCLSSLQRRDFVRELRSK